MYARSLSMALACTIGCMLAVPLAHADIYTWTDASGTINVSNLPPPDGARVSHVVHQRPPPVAAVSDAAREAARQAEVRALSERVQQLEAEANAARSAVPPDLAYPRIAAPPPSVQYNVMVLPQAPQYDAAPAPQVLSGCDPTWFGCAPWWGTYFYPAPVAVSRFPSFHRFSPFRGDHFHGRHHVTASPPIARMRGAPRRG